MAGIKSIEITGAGVSYETVPTVAVVSGFITKLNILNDGSSGAGRFIYDNHTNGMATGGSGTTIVLAGTANAADDYYNGAYIYIESGTGAGQVREITDYTGATKSATVSTWGTNPDTTSRYEIGPKIAFSGGAGSGALAFAYIRNGTIQQIIFPQGDTTDANSRGSGYTTPPTVALTDSTGSSSAQSDPTYSAEAEAWIDTGGGATAVAKLTGTSVASVAVAGSAVARSEGSALTAKYTKVPTLVVTPSNDDTPTTAAVCVPVLTATTLGRITITNAGTGLTNGTGLSITVSGSGTATVDVAGNTITVVTITSAGGSYTSAPTIDLSGLTGFAGSGATAVASLIPTTIASVTVSTPGAGYTAPPTLTVLPADPFCDQFGAAVLPIAADSGGTGAYAIASSTALLAGQANCGAAETMTATLTSTTVESVDITNPGAGYGTPPPITFTGGGSSTKATATSTLNNYNKNAVVTRGGLQTIKVTRKTAPNTKPAGAALAQGGRVPQKLMPGQLVMTGAGLHRVTGVDSLTVALPVGLEAELVSLNVGMTSFVINVTENEAIAGSSWDSLVIPVGTDIIFGGQNGAVREVAKITGAVTLSNKQGTFTTAALTHQGFVAGDPVRIQFIPGHAGSEAAGTQTMLNKFQATILDTLSKKDKSVVYHVGVGLNHTPKFITAAGGFAKATRSDVPFSPTTYLFDTDEQLTVLNAGTTETGPKSTHFGGVMRDQLGKLPDNGTAYQCDWTAPTTTRGKMQKTFVGYTSARLRVYQPKGVPKFAAQGVAFRDDVGMDNNDALMINKTGWITANESPAIAPNPTYMLWVGVGEENLPEFQIAGNDEDILDPVLTIVGYKYKLRPVPDPEVRRMTKRSGGFKYEVIPHALDAYKKQGLGRGTAGPAGPAEGWHEHVRNHKGTPMNKQEFDNATNQITPQTEVILNGTSRRRHKQRRDPRSTHRRDY